MRRAKSAPSISTRNAAADEMFLQPRMPALGQNICAAKKACPLYPRKRTYALHLRTNDTGPTARHFCRAGPTRKTVAPPKNFFLLFCQRRDGGWRVDSRADKLNGYQRFAECGFSHRTTAVLIKAGIDAPERLLSMAPDRIRLIQGIGPILMKEIEQYRAQFK